jgi:alcohol dehydrogenase class IV
LRVEHFIKQGPNVEEEEIRVAFLQFSKNSNQAVLAIGGGSAIDLAKAVIHHCIEMSLSHPFFVAIPTTAGSGSEATHFAVIYKSGKKHSLVHADLLPQMVILDPQLTYSLSPFQAAVSGIDAFSQAVESYWNVKATEQSKQYAAESISLWKDSFVNAVTQPDNENRKQMLMSAHLAGKAINITRTTGPHALSYYLTAKHHIPHGQAVALFLAVFFLYNRPGADLCSLLGVVDGKQAKELIQDIMKKTGLAISFAELGLDKEKILDELLNEVNEERFANNPAAFDRDKLKQLIGQYL